MGGAILLFLASWLAVLIPQSCAFPIITDVHGATSKASQPPPRRGDATRLDSELTLYSSTVIDSSVSISTFPTTSKSDPSAVKTSSAQASTPYNPSH